MSETASTPPAIILVEPQLGQNIGATARAMLNFGLTDLRLVAPRDGWPNPEAEPMSADALRAGVKVTVYPTTPAAIADLDTVAAATARPRDMRKDVADGPGTVARLAPSSVRAGVLFGGEKSGLSNEDVTLADFIMTYPVNPDFSSLNLAQAVLVFAAAWGEGAGSIPEPFTASEPVAARGELLAMMEHFEAELDRAGFFYPPEKTSLMTQNLRNAFTRAGWTSQEVRTFRGAIKALALGRGKARIDPTGRD